MDAKVKCPKCGEAHWQNEAHECATNADDSSKKTKRASGWTTGDSSDLGCVFDAGCCLGELLTGCVVPLVVVSLILLAHVFLPPSHAHGQSAQSPRKAQPAPIVLSRASTTTFPDVFSVRFYSEVRKVVAARLPAATKSSSSMNCYSDEGMRWTMSGDDSLLERYLKLPEGTPGRHRAEEFLVEQGDPDETLSGIEKDRFTQLIARTYFSAWRTAIGKRGLYLGGKFESKPPESVSLGMADALK